MTWKEFKDKVELLGVKDESEIKYIDISGTNGLDFGAIQTRYGEWMID